MPDAPQTFEDALHELEGIVETLEDEPPALEEALNAYERGVLLARHCLERLRDAEVRVEELSAELIEDEM